MNTRIVALVMSMALSAAAEEVVSTGNAARVDGPRFRLGAGAWATVGGYPFRSAGFTGSNLQLGVQLSDRWAVYSLGQLTVWPGVTVASASLLGEYTFGGGWLSIAAGPMLGGTRQYLRFGPLVVMDSASTVVAGHVRLAVNIGPAPVGLWRNRFFIALDGWLGAEVAGHHDGATPRDTTPFPMGGGVSVGYQLM